MIAEAVILAGLSCDPGGNIHRYLDIIQSEARLSVAPLPSCCLSACTMRLVLPRACIRPGTVLGFHAASDGRGRILPSGNSVLISSYQRYPRLQQHILSMRMLDRLEVTYVKASDLHTLGVPYCPKGVNVRP